MLGPNRPFRRTKPLTGAVLMFVVCASTPGFSSLYTQPDCERHNRLLAAEIKGNTLLRQSIVHQKTLILFLTCFF